MARVILVLVMACGGDTTPSCEEAADRAAAALELPGKQDVTTRRAHHDVVLVRCLRDEWHAEARACLAGVKTRADVRACRDKLSPAQVRAMESDFNEITVERDRDGTKARLPDDTSPVRPSPSLEIQVLQDAIRIGGRSVLDDELDRILRAAYVRDKDTQVVVRVGAGIPHGVVVKLMERVKAIGLVRIAIATPP